MSKKIYPESGVELSPLIAKYYDEIMNGITFGAYRRFINKAISDIEILPDDSILDLGCGTGRNAALMTPRLSKSGRITGLDVSDVMEKQFNKKFVGDERIDFLRQRIDIPFNLEKKFDKILISFVIHGLPHDIREVVLQNAADHLNPGGEFYILDYSEFDLAEMPSHHRFIFKKVECPYAFDYLERDWKSILSRYGFSNFDEKLYMKKYVRLLKSETNVDTN